MAKITGQTGLVLASADTFVDGNVYIDTVNFHIELGEYGSLVRKDGVTLQALYSFLMTQWATGDYEKYKFPLISITPGQFELQNGWDFVDANCKTFIRDGGWNLLSSDNSTIYEVWMGIKTLGTFDESTDQAYYVHSAAGSPVNFEFQGEVNQAIQIYGDASHGNFDYRLTSNSEFSVFLREQGKTYASSNLNISQAYTELENNVYALPLSNGTDLDIDASDAYVAYSDTEASGIDFVNATKTITTTDIDFTGLAVGDRIVVTGSVSNNGTFTIATFTDANNIIVEENLVQELASTAVTIASIHQSMSITWGAVQRNIGGTNRDFSIVIDGNSGTLQEIYEFVQYQLRQAGDIDDGAGDETGKITDELLEFVGPTLKTKYTTDGGVYIDNFLIADTNDLVFLDDTQTERTYPYVAAGTINFNDNLQADGASAKYWMYFADAGGNLFNTANAVIVDDNDDADIKGDLTGNVASVTFSFDYEGNVQGGRTANQDANIILVAIGSNNAQYVSATGTLTRSTVMSFTLTAAKERNYVA